MVEQSREFQKTLEDEGFEIGDARTVFKEWFYADQSEECQEFIKAFETVLADGKVYKKNDDGNKIVLTS